MSEKVNEKNAEFDAPNTVKNLVNLDETFNINLFLKK